MFWPTLKLYIPGTLVVCILLYLASCHKTPAVNDEGVFGAPVPVALQPQAIQEASGIADSRINQGYLWTHEDSGNPTEIFLAGHDGKVFKTIFLANTINRDWEDMALAKGPDAALDYIYIADCGDNGQSRDEYAIYRFPEPSLTVDTVRNISKIRFRYPDGAHDAEAFFVDDADFSIYIITKRDSVSQLYRLGPDYSLNAVNIATRVGTLPYNGVVSAAVSGDGSEVLVKTYADVNLYKLAAGQPLWRFVESEPVSIAYQVEPQGEAITFANDNTGFFTLSEKGFASSVKLYYYPRK
ncbi:MAG: hypothetical protein EOO04_11180 [Chitinophagaceae bacterium]|nr:MAG: hypothetical protein EOO04_11180 [Chitinophagaceae bacterium]